MCHVVVAFFCQITADEKLFLDKIWCTGGKSLSSATAAHIIYLVGVCGQEKLLFVFFSSRFSVYIGAQWMKMRCRVNIICLFADSIWFVAWDLFTGKVILIQLNAKRFAVREFNSICERKMQFTKLNVIHALREHSIRLRVYNFHLNAKHC